MKLKKIAAAMAAVLMMGSLAACGGAPEETVPEGAKEVTVGLIQLTEHPSLDEIRTAIETRIEEKAQESGLFVHLEYQNAQGDPSTINTICQQFVGSNVDAIIAIATPAAQGAYAAAQGTDIPIVFSAVTDPAAAGLVENPQAPEGNVTGTSDAIAVDKIFELAAEMTPEAKKFGIIYNAGEENSVTVVEQTRAYLEGAGLAYKEKSVAATSDVQTAAQNLLSDCDAVFVPIDNTVAPAMAVLASEAIKAGKPVYTAADSLVRDGGLATVGINYTELGTKTADMLLKILSGTPVNEVPVEVLEDADVVVNEETAKAIGVDVSAYLE